MTSKSTRALSLTEAQKNAIGKIKLYGDILNDGATQVSFTLPMPQSEEARVAAAEFAKAMNLEKASVVHMEAIDDQFTFFVVYGHLQAQVDVAQIVVPKLDYPEYSFDEVNDLLHNKLGRRVVVLGACIGTDAHTVGIDAIFNMKGYMGNYGLERYPMMQAINLRAQVDVETLADKVVAMKADAVLVSRVVTQRDSHIEEYKKLLVALAQRQNVAPHLIKICGGPRITNMEAREIGYDAGFGPGTLPSHVASYLADTLVKKLV